MSFHCDKKKTTSKPQPFKCEKAITKTACEVSGVGSSSRLSSLKNVGGHGQKDSFSPFFNAIILLTHARQFYRNIRPHTF